MHSGAKPDRSKCIVDDGALPAVVPAIDGTSEWTSAQLFGRAQEVGIRHDGHLYRLRRTKLGKLILTK